MSDILITITPPEEIIISGSVEAGITLNISASTEETLTIIGGGPQGDTGAQGIQGEKGDKGDTGSQGIPGNNGIQGIQGEQGIPGGVDPGSIYNLQIADAAAITEDKLALNYPTHNDVPIGANQNVLFNDAGVWGSDNAFKFDKAEASVKIGSNVNLLPNNPLAVNIDVNSWIQINLQNDSAGGDASADYVITADDGSDTEKYADFGLCNSGYASVAWDVTGPYDTYIFCDGGNVVIGSLSVGKELLFFIAQIEHEGHPADIVAKMDASGVNLPSGKTYRINGSDITIHNHQAGLETAPTITEGTGGNAGKIQIATAGAWFFSDSTYQTITKHTIVASGYLTPTDDITQYLCADRDTDTWILLSDITSIDYLRYILYFVLYKAAGNNNIHFQIFDIPFRGEVENFHKRLLRCNRYDKESGALEYIAVDASLNITIAGGGVWVGNHRLSILAVTTATRQFKCENTGSGWSITSNLNPVINNTQYNGGSGYVTLTDTYWTINFLYRGIEDDDHIYLTLSTAEYATSALAQAATTIPEIPEIISSHAMFVGRVIVQKSATTGYIIESAFSTTFAASSSVTDHGVLTGLGDDDHSQYHNDTRADTWLATKDTADIAEGTSLYFTDERAQDAVGAMATNSIEYVDATPALRLSGDTASPGNNKIYGTNGAGVRGWQDAATAGFTKGSHGITIDGGGSTITTGHKGYYVVPEDCTITGWTILAKSGETTASIVIDVKKCTYAGFPAASSITGTEKPTLSSVQKNQDLTLSTWTTALTAGDILEFNVDSASNITRVNLFLTLAV